MGWRQLSVLLLALFMGSCKVDGDTRIEKEELNFSTTDDSELFFKNVRQLYYDLEELPAANLNVYRLKARTTDVDYPLINLAIVWNWLRDEAYILIEPNELLIVEESIRIQWDSATGETGTFEYSAGNSKEQLAFATSLYNHILEGDQFAVSLNGGLIPLLDKGRDREAFRITMSDYFRLTRTFDN